MKGILGISITTTLNGPIVVFAGIEQLTTLVLIEMGIGDVNFSDTTSALGIFDNYTLTCEGDTPSADMDEVGV